MYTILIMQNLRSVLEDAKKNKVAVGHFNISDLATAHAIADVAREMNVPVMIGVSEGEREFVGVKMAAAIVREIYAETGMPIFLNADHTHSLEKAIEAAKAGYDEIIFDASKESFEKNVELTRAAVVELKSINPDIIVEGEIGYIGSASEIIDKTPDGAALSKSAFSTVEEAVQFVKETGVDVLAPAVGNMHGLLASMVSGDVKKHLDIDRIKQIADATGVFLTLHGGSGTANADFVEAAHAGMTIVHVNTEIRLAWRRGVEEGLKKSDHEVAPYKLLAPAVVNMKAIIEDRLKLFNAR